MYYFYAVFQDRKNSYIWFIDPQGGIILNSQIQQVLELFSQPAFFVRDDMVVWCNSAARSIILEGTPLAALWESAPSLFTRWSREGTLQVPLTIRGSEYDASVQAMEDGDLFVVSRRSDALMAAASAVVSASGALRKPLHAMLNAADDIFEQMEKMAHGCKVPAAANLNRAIYQLVRLCGQMSDGGEFLLRRKGARRSPADMSAFLERFVKQTTPLIEATERHLVYVAPGTPVNADIDPNLIERALYNLLSNAMNYTPEDGTITLSAQILDRQLLISVTDSGEGIATQVMSTLFERFTVSDLGDSRWGIGLGLPMVREIARLHNGTVMAGKNPDGTGASVGFSISLEPTMLNLFSPSVFYDYCGGFNHGLVELSDILDAKMYNPCEIH